MALTSPWIGEIKTMSYQIPNGVIPAGWILCNGQAISITQYPLLYAIYGTTFNAQYTGAGSVPSGYFVVPNNSGQTLGMPGICPQNPQISFAYATQEGSTGATLSNVNFPVGNQWYDDYGHQHISSNALSGNPNTFGYNPQGTGISPNNYSSLPQVHSIGELVGDAIGFVPIVYDPANPPSEQNQISTTAMATTRSGIIAQATVGATGVYGAYTENNPNFGIIFNSSAQAPIPTVTPTNFSYFTYVFAGLPTS